MNLIVKLIFISILKLDLKQNDRMLVLALHSVWYLNNIEY